MGLDSDGCQEQTDHSFLCGRSLSGDRQKAMVIPKDYRENATFYTDDWQAYTGIPLE